MSDTVSNATTAQGVFPQTLEVSLLLKVEVYNQEQLDYCRDKDAISFIADIMDSLNNGDFPVGTVSINGFTPDDIRKRLQSQV